MFAVGGPAGEAFVPSAWEAEFYGKGDGPRQDRRRRRRSARACGAGRPARGPFLVRDQPVARELLARLGEA